jgi:hypothetical protein
MMIMRQSSVAMAVALYYTHGMIIMMDHPVVHVCMRPYALFVSYLFVCYHDGTFFPLQRGAGPMALMLWLDWVT